MASQVNPPRGMRDFLPTEKKARSVLLDKIVSTYATHGFQEIETPALEQIERLTSGQGGDNEKLAFRVLKRGEELQQALESENPEELSDLGLRYDLTVPLTRFYATNHSKLPKVFKAIQVGPVWRAERPQKGRYRQFMQCDIDILGDESMVSEVELVNASLNALAAIGITGAVVRVNHRELLMKSLESLGLVQEHFGKAMIIIDKLDKLGVSGVLEELQESFGSNVGEKAKVWLEGLAQSVEVPETLRNFFNAIERIQPGKVRFDPTLVRGMGYYTGIVFEIEHPDSGAAIGGGGRYDGMVGKWLGSAVPAVGISIGFERVADLVVSQGKLSKSLVLIFEPELFAEAIAIQQEAIAKGYSVRIDPKPKKLNLLLDSLKEQGFSSFTTLTTAGQSLSDLEIRPIS